MCLHNKGPIRWICIVHVMFAFSSIRLIFISHKKVHLQTQAKTGDQGKWNDKITWKNVDAEEINFGPYTDESNEGATTEEEATTEEGANNRKAMGEPQWKWKCRTPWSMKRKASDPPGLLDLEERTGHCAITISQPTKFCAKKQQKKAHNSLSMYC